MKTTILPPITVPAGAAPPGAAVEEFVMPASMDQQRWWALDQLASGNPACNVAFGVELKGPLDVDALHKALNAIIRRHESLRTCFAWLDGEVKQVISSEVPFYFQHKNLSSVPADQREARRQEEMIAEARRPVSLTKAPIFRARLLHFDTEEHVLLLSLHHSMCDGWATGILVREIGVFYQAILDGKPADLPELPIQYADYAVWQRDWMKTPEYQTQLAFWAKLLEGGAPMLDFPTDHPRVTGTGLKFPGFIENRLLPLRLTDEIKRKCQELDVTLFMFFYATFATLLHRYTGQSRFIVGTSMANRPTPELRNLVGQFANPMMLRPELADEPTFRELVHRVRDPLLGAMSHQNIPLESILEQLDLNSGGRDKPAIQAFVVFQRDFLEPAQSGGITIRPLQWVSPGSIVELTLQIVERAEGISLHLEYNSALFENKTICRLLTHFEKLLAAALEEPDTLVSELPLLTDEERAKLWPAISSKEYSSEGSRPGFDPKAVLQDIDVQLDKHFRQATDSRGALIEPPLGAKLVVLDAHLRLLPAGVIGDLYLGGFSPELVSSPDQVSGPLDTPTPIPLLRTELLARNRDDGKIELLGKPGDFVRINGFRVSLRLVKALLLQHPDVKDAAAVVTQETSGENQLTCYVVSKPGSSPSENDLRALLKGKINDYVLPAHILTVAALSKNAQGEVVAEFLPKPVTRPQLIDDERVPLEAILYLQLIEIWVDILKVPSVTIEDNFFALGGNSLQAFRMMVRTEKLCGRSLPLSLLLTGATIANLARFISQTQNESGASLYTVQAKGERPPLFFLHGDWAGGGFYCKRLSEPMGEDQPFYALPPLRVGKQEVLSMEDMAAHHVAVIQEHTPHGPYILGGYCIGATVAMEIARQLVKKGEKVNHLLLIDPPPCTLWLRWVWSWVDKMGGMMNWDLQKKIHFFDISAVSFARWLARSPSSKLTSLRRRLGLLKSKGPTPETAGQPAGEGEGEILKSLDYAIYVLAYLIYHPSPFTIPVSFYFPDATLSSPLSWVKRTTDLAQGECIIETVPGDHQTCITKYTAAIGEMMKKSLNPG